MASVWSAIQTLGDALHWNRVMSASLIILGALTALGSIPDEKMCKRNTSDWQGWVWLAMVVSAVLACFTELIDDLATERKDGPLRVEGLTDEISLMQDTNADAVCCNFLHGYNGSSDTARRRRLRCRRRCVAYGFVRFLSNCFIMAFALTVVAFIYLRDPSCWLWNSKSLINTTPVAITQSPSTSTSPSEPPPGTPWTTAPSEVFFANKQFSYVLFATAMALLVFVGMRILLLKYPPKNDEKAAQAQAALDAQARNNDMIIQAIQDAAAAAAVASEAATTAADAATTAADASAAAADAVVVASDAVAAAADAATLYAQTSAKMANAEVQEIKPGGKGAKKSTKDSSQHPE